MPRPRSKNLRQRYGALPAAERRVGWVASLLFPLVRLLLRVVGFRRCLSLLRRLPLPSLPPLPPERYGQLVGTTARLNPARPNCLARSLTLWRLLDGAGYDSTLRIGVRHHEGAFQAHAWLERDGVVLNDAPDVGQRYAVFDRLPPLASFR